MGHESSLGPLLVTPPPPTHTHTIFRPHPVYFRPHPNLPPPTAPNLRPHAPQTYDLRVRSTKPGTYEVNALIAGLPLMGSPIRPHFSSTVPDMARCEITGSGTQTFKQNEAATVMVRTHLRRHAAHTAAQ